MTTHPFKPVYDCDSEILILGSFPSVKSRSEGFFYGNPWNRFWSVLAAVYDCEIPDGIDRKRKFLIDHRVALWDVVASCEITGSSDSSIRNVKANDFSVIMDTAGIDKIFTNGKTAEKYYKKYIYPSLKKEAICLPSTSPANASYNFEMLVNEWRIIKNTKS